MQRDRRRERDWGKRESVLTTTYVSLEIHLFSSVTKLLDYPCWDCRLTQLWKNELNAILLNQPSAWLVQLFCAEDRCHSLWQKQYNMNFQILSFFANSQGKDIYQATKLGLLQISRMKISEGRANSIFSRVGMFLGY